MGSYRKLNSSIRLKKMMQRDYLKTKLMHHIAPSAWITSGAPVEILRSMGIISYYPENYGALCAARRVSGRLCQEAEDRGYSRELCAYGRNHMGSIYRPDKAPFKGLPRPDMLIACNNICGTVLKWYQALSRELKLPLFFLDTPYSTDAVKEETVTYVEKQFRALVEFVETHTDRVYNEDKLLEVMSLAQEATQLWTEIRKMGRKRPSPINAPDLFVNMAPIVVLRGTRSAVDYYKVLLQELQERAELGQGALLKERHRLLWDNIAIWHRVLSFYGTFTAHDACFVVDSYTGAWSNEIDAKLNPLRSLAKSCTNIFLNQGIKPREELLVQMIKDYQVDAFVMHANRSCKPYSQLQYDLKRLVTERTGVPGLIIEADMCDPRNYAQESVQTRIEAFLENLA